MRHQFLASLVLAVALLGDPATAQTSMMKVDGVDQNDTLNVRSGPGADFSDIGDLQPDEFVMIQGYDPSRNWAIINHQGQIAYVAARYLIATTRPDGSSVFTGPHQVTGIAANDSDGGLVMRDGPGGSFARVAVLPDGSDVHVIQRNREDTWAMVSSGTNVGWVSLNYLTSVEAPEQGTQQPMPSPTPAVAPDGTVLPADFQVTGVSQGDFLNFRDAPNTSGAILGRFAPGDVVQVLSMATANWAYVTNGEIAGYVNISFLTKTSASQGGVTGTVTTVNGFILGLSCLGTEPFWSLDIAQDRTVTYTRLIGGPAPLTSLVQTTPSSLTGGYPFTFAAPPYAGEISMQQCSDGMSDNTYTMRLNLTAPNQSGGTDTLYGCCNVMP